MNFAITVSAAVGLSLALLAIGIAWSRRSRGAREGGTSSGDAGSVSGDVGSHCDGGGDSGGGDSGGGDSGGGDSGGGDSGGGGCD